MLPELPPRIPQRLQELDPASARVCLHVASFVAKELEVDLRGAQVLVAVSGGADSLALLLILHWLAPSLDMTLHAMHLDHGLRPESPLEAEWCRAFCAILNIPVTLVSLDIPAQQKKMGAGIEEASRTARYAALHAEAKAQGCDWVATGHQLNDLAEDVLMRLTRGTGWPALGGMAGADAGRQLLRPLLLTPRSDLEGMLTRLNVPWLTDGSNFDAAYLRNRVRHAMLPLFLQENPAFLTSVAHLWRLGQLDTTFLAKQLPIPQPQSPHPAQHAPVSPAPAIITLRNAVAHLHKALRLRFYKQTLAGLGEGHPQLTSLFALDAAWHGKQFPKTIQFNGKRFAVVTKEAIHWHCTGENNADEQ